MRLATFSKFKWNFQRPLVGCDYIANNYIDPETRCNFQRPLAGCDWTARKTYGTTFRLILRPLAGCDDLSVIKAKNPKEICSYVPLRGVIRENDMWRVIDHEICSYVPLRGVIGKNEQK